MGIEGHLLEATKAVLDKRVGQAGFEDQPFHFSEGHERRMQALFARHTAKRAAAKKAALAACLAAVFAASALCFAKPVSASVYSLLAKWLGGRAKYSSEEGACASTAMPQIIPQGYELKESIGSGGLFMQVYANGEGTEITFMSSAGETSLSINSENVEVSEELVNGIFYHKYTALKDGVENAVVWENGGSRLAIFSVAPMEGIFLMAISVE